MINLSENRVTGDRVTAHFPNSSRVRAPIRTQECFKNFGVTPSPVTILTSNKSYIKQD